MAASNYATFADLTPYLKQAATSANQTLMTTMLEIASRMVDRYCERPFYADGASSKWFDGDGTGRLYIPYWDFYSLTVLKIALVENGDPADNTQWYTISGDGKTPPSNFYLGPDNPLAIGAASDQVTVQPFHSIYLPKAPKSGSTTDYLSTFTKGRRTVGITANWGWPVVPDVIRDCTIKIAVRMWRSKDAGWDGQQGSPEIGTADVTRLLDRNDIAMLQNYRKMEAA